MSSMYDFSYRGLEPKRIKVLACHTVIEEMSPVMPSEMAFEAPDFGFRLTHNNLKQTKQEAIDASCFVFETIILGYNSCSVAFEGYL